MNPFSRFVGLYSIAISVFLLFSTLAEAQATERSILRLCAIDIGNAQPLNGVGITVSDTQSTYNLEDDGFCYHISFVSRSIDISFRRLGYQGRTIRLERYQDKFLSDDTSVLIRDQTLYVGLESIMQLLSAAVISDSILSNDRRKTHTLSTDTAAILGASSMRSVIGLLPFTFARSSRNELTLSLRGSRREQVVVLFDGVSLNDASTGIADISDMPLAAISSAAVSLGVDPISSGPGASGGVLSLSSSAGSHMSLNVGSFGRKGIDGAVSRNLDGLIVRLGASFEDAQNDFPFVNDAGASGASLREYRVNNDVSRYSLFGSLRASSFSVFALHSSSESGMVGAMNVRDYDQDRRFTDRSMLRVNAQFGSSLIGSSVRRLGLKYRDPNRAELDFDSDVLSADVDVTVPLWMMKMKSGVGGDRVVSSAGIEEDRVRAYLSANTAKNFGQTRFSGGFRLDAISATKITPSFSVSLVRDISKGELGLRFAQSVRSPTLYDLHFSSPQRVSVKALDAERVKLDAELLWKWMPTVRGLDHFMLEASGVHRITKSAIVWFPGNFGWTPSNVGEERLTGAEGMLDMGTKKVQVQTWMSLYKSDLFTGGLVIPTPYIPRHAGGSRASISLLGAVLSTAMRWMGPRPYTAGPRDSQWELDAVSMLDITAGRRMTVYSAEVILSATIENVTNTQWQSVRGFPAAGRSWSAAFTIRPKVHENE